MPCVSGARMCIIEFLIRSTCACKITTTRSFKVGLGEEQLDGQSLGLAVGSLTWCQAVWLH